MGRKAPKPRLSKEERRAKYTQLARQKQRNAKRRIVRQQSICFQCRRRGHTLAECPENANHRAGPRTAQSSSRCCYKCGSTEHGLAQCPDYRRGKIGNENLPFAKCFVCQQTGHLASKCPENSKGIYVIGGECQYCGSKQHLKSACPKKKNEEKEDESSGGDDEAYADLIGGKGDELPEPKTRKDKAASKDQRNTPSKKRRVVKF